MSYKSQAVLGFVLAGPFMFAAGAGILLLLYAILMLRYATRPVEAGAQPGLCKTWGHDWRAILPGIPEGKTCRNCLARKDGIVLAWRSNPPPGVLTEVFYPHGVAVPINVLRENRKRRLEPLVHILDPPRAVPSGPAAVEFAGPG